MVRYVFDPAKDVSNQAKHGLTLALAEVLFSGPYVSVTDDRFNYGEVRDVAFGWIGTRMHVCVYADRNMGTSNAERRIISLRKANQREVLRYGDTFE